MSEEITAIAEENMPRRDKEKAGWVDQLRYNKSFTAKLILSDETVKEYYCALATELLSYERVCCHTGWSSAGFTAGRTVIARCAINGKTLCLYLATDPQSMPASRFGVRDVSSVRKYEKTPALIRIRTQGAVAYAVRCIGDVAMQAGLVKRDPPAAPILPRLFPVESIHSLVSRGLIRFVGGSAAHNSAASATEGADSASDPSTDSASGTSTSAAAAAVEAAEARAAFAEASEAVAAGDAGMKLSRRKMLRALDEGWVSTIEEALPAINELMRSPSHFIAETEEVLPMELTRKITGRSVVHLCQHTDYISSVDGDNVTPSKLLNVFREDSILTYENKFLNTLLAHLYFFVTKRYRIALDCGVDEQVDSMEFEDSFFHGELRGKLRLSIELSEKSEDGSGVKKSFLGTPLWARVEKLNEIVKAYMESDFVREMGRNYVNPPIMHTNAIMKNKYFRRCLDLWNYLQGYDESGMGLTVCETVRDPDDTYIRELYNGAAAQYWLFLRQMSGDIGADRVLAEYTSAQLYPPINVRVRDGEHPVSAEDFAAEVVVGGAFARTDAADAEAAAPDESFVYDPENRDIRFAAMVALRAAEFYDKQSELDAEKDPTGSLGDDRYEKSFDARLRLANDEIKEYYVGLANALLAYDKVNMRKSRMGCSFVRGRTRLAFLTMKGKTLCLYAALDPEQLPDAYRVRDVSDVKRYAATPAMLRVRSDRWMKYARQMIEQLAVEFELKPLAEPKTVLSVEDFELLTYDEMLEQGWVRRVSVRPAAADSAEKTDGQLGELSADTLPDTSGNTSSDMSADTSDEQSAAAAPAPDDTDIPLPDTMAEPGEILVTYDSESEPDAVQAEASAVVGGESRAEESDAVGYDDEFEPDYTAPSALSVGNAGRSPGAAGGDSEHTADYFENSSADPDNYTIDEREAEEELRTKNAHLLSDIRYPGAMDYSRPIQHGVDDSSGFMKDEEEHEPEELRASVGAPESPRRFGRLFAALFRRKEHENENKK